MAKVNFLLSHWEHCPTDRPALSQNIVGIYLKLFIEFT